jgi:hypothetical protein
VEADDAGLIERFRDKWIGDNEEMLADLHAVILASLSAAKVEAEKEVERLLFEPIEHDASLNLQGVLDDLRGQANPNDGGVCATTVDRVIDQLEKVRAVLKGRAQGDGE